MQTSLGQRLEVLSPAKRALLEKRLGKPLAQTSNPCVIRRRADAATAPLSYSQEGLLFMEQLEPGTSRYNVVDAVRVRGHFDIDVVQQSLDRMVERHEALRTTFTESNGVWHQTIRPPSPAALQTVEIEPGVTGSTEERAFELLRRAIDEPMNLVSGPLFSASLLRIDETDALMLIKMHHILSDGWSLGVFWREFAAIYSALIEGKAVSLPDLPIQFGDYASWLREYLQREIDRQTKFWTSRLEGAPALLEMPTDRPRPSVQSANGAQETMDLPQDLLDAILELCKNEGTTLYMALLAGFNALIARYTGMKDLVIGTPVAGRNRTETEDLIGYFVNTLVLRSDLSGDPTFREILARSRSTVLDAFSHQELPFEKIVEAVMPERSLSYNPIYQVAFALQDAAGAKMRIPHAEVEPVKHGLNSSKFDLFLSARETENGFAVSVEYNIDLFDKATIQRFISHYRNVLEAVVRDPEERLSELPLLSHAERHQILVDWNDTAVDYSKDPVHQLFSSKAAQMPDRTAITAGERSISYRQLDDWSNRIANFLQQSGVEKGSRVGVCLGRSPEMIAVTIGILKCGASYVPIDAANPDARLRQIAEDSGVTAVFTNSETSPAFEELDILVLDVTRVMSDIDGCSDAPPVVAGDREDVAYVMYTSGSTGQPKGALIPHRAINRLVLNTDYVRLDENDRIAHLSNVAFDAATFEIWGALLNGGCIVVFDKDIVLSPDRFADEIKAAGITAMFITTSLFNLIARERPDAFAGVGSVLTGGELFDPAAAKQVLLNGAPNRLLNVYGPTESTTFATWKVVTPQTLDDGTVPIGKPIANTSVLVLDNDFNPVPVGVVGEIFIGGDGLALGYLDRPELNAERFVEPPAHKISVSPESGTVARLYRTGDLGKYLPNGDIECIGRRDAQVKIRGFRIELGEVEGFIEAHPAISQAIVIAVRDERDHRMVAFYVCEGETKMEPDGLLSHLRNSLPSYMIPAAWVELDQFPINRNGKIDRRELEMRARSLEVSTSIEAKQPTTELEIKLTWIWKKILGINSVGINDNFFDLGGHSLAAVRLFLEIEKSLGCRLQLATLFHAPTIAQLATVVRQGSWRPSWESLVPIKLGGSKEPIFCVHAVGGNILEYNRLAEHLGADRPFYGLQSIGLDGRSRPLTDIREMAAAYIREIKAVQPTGPYYLGGRSFGGTVAYEMARQLADQGEEIAMLAIFDSYPKGWRKLLPPALARSYNRRFLKMRAERHLRIWLRLGTVQKLSYAVTKLRFKSRKLKNLAWRAAQKLRPSTDSVSTHIRNIEEINYAALRAYVPGLYDGKVTFFCAKEEVCPEENLTGWRRLAIGGVDVVEVPGDHQTMIKEPHVAELAAKFEETIGSVRGSAAGDTGC